MQTWQPFFFNIVECLLFVFSLDQVPVYVGGGGIQPQLSDLEPRLLGRSIRRADSYSHRCDATSQA